MDYGIAVRNKFELFLDDEDADPLEILRLKEEENSKAAVKEKESKSQKNSKSAKNKKNNKAQTAAQDQKSKPVEAKDSKKDDKPLRNKSRNDDRPNRPPRENRDRDLPPRRQQQQDGRPMSSGGFGQQTSPTGGDQFRERGEGRGRGRGRGGRGGGRGRGGFDRFGKREFERHSGSDKTGIKATEKREGAGAHNWGTVKDDVEDQMNTAAPAEGSADWAAQAEDTENVQPDAAPETNEEGGQEEETSPSEMTLDEWKALQIKEKQAQSFNIRKAGEGCDNKQWKQTYVLKKKANEEDDEEESEEEEDDDELDHRKKNYVPIEITFGDSRRGSRGGRGGRGGGGRGMERRGRGGRGAGPNSGRGGKREQAPNVEDELDFPSLSKS